MHVKAFLFYGTFLTVWMASILIVPVAVIFSIGYKNHVLLFLLALYYGRRVLFPLREWPAFRRAYRFVAHHACDGGYFDTYDMVFDDECDVKSMDDNAPYGGRLFAFHPHGITLIGWTMSIVDPQSEGWHCAWLGTKMTTVLPLLSEFMVWSGVQSVESKNLKRLMKQKRNVSIAVGGFEEATYYGYGHYRVFVKSRAGFIKYAMRYGYTIHPVFTFGEERTYTALQAGQKFRVMLNKLKIPGVVFFGIPWAPLLPRPHINVTTVVGPALKPPQADDPSTTDVAEWHDKYISALTALFEKHKSKYAVEGAAANLEII